MGRQRESNLGSRVDRWLTAQPDIFFFNVHGHAMQKKGVPDRVGNCGLVAFYIELKNPGERLKPIQEAIARKIRRSGGEVACCESLVEVQDFIQKLRALALDGAGFIL